MALPKLLQGPAKAGDVQGRRVLHDLHGETGGLDARLVSACARGRRPESRGRGPGSTRGRSPTGGGLPAARPASLRAAATQARSLAASARFRRTYSKSTAGRSALVPLGPRMRHSRPKSSGFARPRPRKWAERRRRGGRAPGSDRGELRLGWHGLRFCIGHATDSRESPFAGDRGEIGSSDATHLGSDRARPSQAGNRRVQKVGRTEHPESGRGDPGCACPPGRG